MKIQQVRSCTAHVWGPITESHVFDRAVFVAIVKISEDIPWLPWKSVVSLVDPRVVVAILPTVRLRSPPLRVPSEDCRPLSSSLPGRVLCADGSGAGNTAPGTARRYPSTRGRHRMIWRTRPPPDVDDPFGRSWEPTRTTWHRKHSVNT